MTEQLPLQQQLHNPVRLETETFEDFQKRRKDSNELAKMVRRGRLIHPSVWYTQETDKEGKPVTRRHTKTFVKPKEEV